MRDWTPEFKLMSVLATTKEYLARSELAGLPDEDPREAIEDLDELISHLLDPAANPAPEFYRVLFAPTGPIQEIAMANDWHDEYAALSAEYDGLEHLIAQ